MEKLQTKEGVREIQEIMSRSNAADKKRIGEILVDHFTNHGLTFLEEEDEECEDPEQGYEDELQSEEDKQKALEAESIIEAHQEEMIKERSQIDDLRKTILARESEIKKLARKAKMAYKPMKYTYKAVATVDVYLDKEDVYRLHSEYGGDFEDFFDNEFCMSAEEFDNVTYSYQSRPMTDKEIEDHIDEENEDEY